MGGPNSNQTHVPNQAEEEAEDGVETLSLCDLPLYGDNDTAVKCDGGCCSGSSEEECEQELFEFSSGDLGSAPVQRVEKIVFCGRIIHFKERSPPKPCVARSPGKDCMKKNMNMTETMHRMNRRRPFRWKLRLFRKPGTSYCKMKTEDENNISGQKKKRQRRMYSRGASGKWFFLIFGSTRFPVAMGLRDIKSRQRRRTNPSKLFGFSDYAESEVGDDGRTPSTRNSWGLLNILRYWSSGNGRDHSSSRRNAVVKVSNGCFPIRRRMPMPMPFS